MSGIDWTILVISLLAIVSFGYYKSRGVRSTEAYLRGDNSLPWYTVGLSVMATQASAITFLSAPGQAYTDGMRFVQFYFGLPLALIVVCAVMVPIYHRLKVYTAYEYLESRFDLKTRSLAAFLFLIQRGIASGLTIFAPAIILSVLLGWNIYITIVFIGSVVILYTVLGGTKAVSYTQLMQMGIILTGMGIAGVLIFSNLPEGIGLNESLTLSGKLGKMNVVDTEFNLDNQYNIWSGLIGGFFLSLSYFGTDQSQVSRYLGSRSEGQSKLGLIFNGLVKIPMQFSILLIGVFLFSFYMLNTPPVFFNEVELDKARKGIFSREISTLEKEHVRLHEQIALSAEKIARSEGNEADLAGLKSLYAESRKVRSAVIYFIEKGDPLANKKDVNYIFLSYVLNYLPHGIIGLLIAVILAASMSSTSSELSALASTFVVDIYRRNAKKERGDEHYYKASRWATFGWGVYAIGVAMLCTNLGSLIE
jgi:solute:Na+ symporter, SSS family